MKFKDVIVRAIRETSSSQIEAIIQRRHFFEDNLLQFEHELLFGESAELEWTSQGCDFSIDLSKTFYHPQFEEARLKHFENIKSGSTIFDIHGNIFIAKALAAHNCKVIAKCKNEDTLDTFYENKDQLPTFVGDNDTPAMTSLMAGSQTSGVILCDDAIKDCFTALSKIKGVDHVIVSDVMKTMCFLGKFKGIWDGQSEKTEKDIFAVHVIFTCPKSTDFQKVKTDILEEMLQWEYTQHKSGIADLEKRYVKFSPLKESIIGQKQIHIQIKLPLYFLNTKLEAESTAKLPESAEKQTHEPANLPKLEQKLNSDVVKKVKTYQD